MKMKYLSAIGLAGFVLSLALTSSAAVIGSLNIVPTTVNQRQAIAVNGVCTSTGANIMVDVTVTNGNQVLRSTPTAAASGAFATVISIPDVYPSGTAAVSALCANGDMLTGSIQVNPSTGLSLIVSGTGTLGQSLSVFGSCGSNTSAGSLVSFTLNQNGTMTNIGSTTTTGSTGSFSGTVNFAAPVVAGSGVISAVCPDNNVISSGVLILNPTVVTPPSPTPTPTPTPPGSVGGVSTTPVGGVAAGKTGLAAIAWAGIALIMLGLYSSLPKARKNQSSIN